MLVSQFYGLPVFRLEKENGRLENSCLSASLLDKIVRDCLWLRSIQNIKIILRLCDLSDACVQASGREKNLSYDANGRRVRKKVYSGSTDNWSLVTDHRSASGGTPIPEGYNQQYPRTKMKTEITNQ
jgi:hypothetical protein